MSEKKLTANFSVILGQEHLNSGYFRVRRLKEGPRQDAFGNQQTQEIPKQGVKLILQSAQDYENRKQQKRVDFVLHRTREATESKELGHLRNTYGE